jgi:hypothetical protein
MNKTNKISSLNLFYILVLNHIFSFVCFKGQFSLESLPAIFLAWIINTFLMIFVVNLYKKGFDFKKYLQENTIFSVFLFVLAIFILSVSFIQIKNVCTQISIPFDSSLATTIIIVLICIYTASLGIKSMAKSSIIFLVMFIIGMIIILLGSVDKIQISSVYLTENNTVFSQFISFISYSFQPFILFVFMPFSEDIKYKQISIYCAILLIFDILLCLLCITVIHQKMIFTDFPFITLSTLSQPLQIQRFDTLYIIIFVLLFVFRITSLTCAGVKIFDILTKKIKFKVTVTLISASFISFLISIASINLCLISGIIMLILFISFLFITNFETRK